MPAQIYPSTKLQPLEFRVLKRLKDWGCDGCSILIACSGGRDSVALARALVSAGARLGIRFGLMHVHHGSSADSQVTDARNRAYLAVRSLANELRTEFFALRPGPSWKMLRSEAELRAFRLHALRLIRRRENFAYIAIGHHRSDLFETRLIRLIRGTGPVGLQAMREKSQHVLRPFLSETPDELTKYMRSIQKSWHEDPTNRDLEPLRNWLRLKWLPELEKKRAGGVAAFARSLELTAQETALIVKPTEQFTESGLLDRRLYIALENAEQQRVVVAFLRSSGCERFTSGQVQEIVKRLNTRKLGRVRFEMLGIEWEVNVRQIVAIPKS